MSSKTCRTLHIEAHLGDALVARNSGGRKRLDLVLELQRLLIRCIVAAEGRVPIIVSPTDTLRR